jgi:predicted DNA-binding transcriptional regulator AlpA
MINRRLRYRDLVAKGVVRNRQTLKNWIEKEGFPPGELTGPNSRTFDEKKVEEWLSSRPTAPKPAIPTKRPRGRPRKVGSNAVDTKNVAEILENV